MRTITAIIVSLMKIAIHEQTMLTQPTNAFTGTGRLVMRQVRCVDSQKDSLCWDFSKMETMIPKDEIINWRKSVGDRRETIADAI